jgi:hypothetical protein
MTLRRLPARAGGHNHPRQTLEEPAIVVVDAHGPGLDRLADDGVEGGRAVPKALVKSFFRTGQDRYGRVPRPLAPAGSMKDPADTSQPAVPRRHAE